MAIDRFVKGFLDETVAVLVGQVAGVLDRAGGAHTTRAARAALAAAPAHPTAVVFAPAVIP